MCLDTITFFFSAMGIGDNDASDEDRFTEISGYTGIDSGEETDAENENNNQANEWVWCDEIPEGATYDQFQFTGGFLQ